MLDSYKLLEQIMEPLKNLKYKLIIYISWTWINHKDTQQGSIVLEHEFKCGFTLIDVLH